MYDLFDTFFNPWYDDSEYNKKAPKQQASQNTQNLMKTDIKELDNGYELEIDLPGFKKDEVTLELKNGVLTIQAVKGLDKDETDKKGKYIRQERYAGACSRSFYVGDAVEPEDVSAKFEDGILTISVPKNVKKQLPKNSAISIQ